MNTGEF